MENQFAGCLSLKQAKARYLAIAREFHPVNGRDPIRLFMARMEYQQLARDPTFGFYQHADDIQEDFLQYPDIIDKLLSWRLEVELIGTWTWVQGNCYPYREQLVEMGFTYEPIKQAWYSRPASCRSANPKPLPFDKIKALHSKPLENLLGPDGKSFRIA